MTHDPKSTGVQREIRPGAAVTDTAITASSPPAFPKTAQASDDIRLPGVTLVRRLSVLAVGLVVGAIFALYVAGPMMPFRMQFTDRALVWTSVMGGPVLGTYFRMAEFHPSIRVGWLGLLLIPAHPIRPSLATGLATAFGFLLWFFAGFLAVMVAVWGA